MCASMCRPVTSPHAQMLGTLVRPCSSTRMPRADTSTPASSKPRSVTTGVRPVALRMYVAESLCRCPGGILIVQLVAVDAQDRQDRWISMPPRRRILSSSSAMSPSQPEAILGNASYTVTSVPISWKKEANSRPMYPPPMIAIRSGTAVSWNAEVESRTRSPSMPGIGGTAGREPEATRMFAASWRSPSTSTALRPTRRPVPWSTSTLVSRSSADTPRLSVPTTLSLRATNAGRSKLGASTIIPNAAASRYSRNSREDRRKVFAGMHPTFRQVPPSSAFSTTATRLPRLPAWAAAS